MMRRSPLVLIPQHFGCLLFDRRSSRYLPFDHECTAILRDLLRIGVDEVMTEAEARDDRARVGFIASLDSRGFFTVDGFLAATALEAEPPADHLLGPLAVHLEVIAACNLRCGHCFAGQLPRKASLSVDDCDRLFAELASLGSFRLGLTGGEPLLRKDLLEILDAATDRGLHPCLTTNALLIDETMARELGRRDLVWLNVSLEGATARSNDRVRGLGTFTEVKRRLRLLAEHARFTLAFTITRDNAEEVEACAALAHELGAHTAVFRPLYPVGVAREHPEWMPDFADYSDALGRLSELGLGEDLHAIDPFSPQARDRSAGRIHDNPGCGAANLVASISADGEVNPCSFLGSDYDAGNIRERSFAEIWHDSQVFRRMRATTGDFAGGCRARALAATGSVDGADPWQVEWQRLRSRGTDAPAPGDNLHVARSEGRSL